MPRINYTIEPVQGGFALTVDGQYQGRFGSKAAAERFRKLVTSGQKLDPRTAMLRNEARAEHNRKFAISNRVTGEYLGEYAAVSAEGAIEAWAQDNGFDAFADFAARHPSFDVDELHIAQTSP